MSNNQTNVCIHMLVMQVSCCFKLLENSLFIGAFYSLFQSMCFQIYSNGGNDECCPATFPLPGAQILHQVV